MKTRTHICAIAVAAFAATAFGAAPAQAASISIVGDQTASTEGIGDFAGTIDYTFDGVVGELVITLTNTTDPEDGGWITGLVFNIDGDDADATLIGTTDRDFVDTSDEPAPPFGDFEAGAGLHESFLGNGSPRGGLAIGDTATFIFEVTGGDAASLTAMSFVSGDNEHNFIVRFRGGVESDKVPVVGAEVVPLPAPIALGAFGMIGAAVGSRRLRRNRTA